jgi:hypothetical protein
MLPETGIAERLISGRRMPVTGSTSATSAGWRSCQRRIAIARSAPPATAAVMNQPKNGQVLAKRIATRTKSVPPPLRFGAAAPFGADAGCVKTSTSASFANAQYPCSRAIARAVRLPSASRSSCSKSAIAG